jgi:hypothetical protein
MLLRRGRIKRSLLESVTTSSRLPGSRLHAHLAQDRGAEKEGWGGCRSHR